LSQCLDVFCKVLKIDKTLKGLSLAGSQLWIEDAPRVTGKEIVKTLRIGIHYTLNDLAGSHQWPLRFFLKEIQKSLNQR
jgi:3-methyladenine DNA glycosylase Mpg